VASVCLFDTGDVWTGSREVVDWIQLAAMGMGPVEPCSGRRKPVNLNPSGLPAPFFHSSDCFHVHRALGCPDFRGGRPAARRRRPPPTSGAGPLEVGYPEATEERVSSSYPSGSLPGRSPGIAQGCGDVGSAGGRAFRPPQSSQCGVALGPCPGRSSSPRPHHGSPCGKTPTGGNRLLPGEGDGRG